MGRQGWVHGCLCVVMLGVALWLALAQQQALAQYNKAYVGGWVPGALGLSGGLARLAGHTVPNGPGLFEFMKPSSNELVW